MDDNNPDLESFRKQWREEVTARSKTKVQSHQRKDLVVGPSSSQSEGHQIQRTLPPSHVFKEAEESTDGLANPAHHDLENTDDVRRLGAEGTARHPSGQMDQETHSALEHYEMAIESEDQGRMGDSVSLYRKAFRLDAGVDRIYKNKYFPPTSSKPKPVDPNPSNAAVTVPNTAHHSLHGPHSPETAQLILQFSSLSIPSAPSLVEGSPPPPCPISTIPLEVLLDILLYTAITDVAAFSRLSLVCKRLAYIVATEDGIWETICCRSELGFAAMPYNWRCSLSSASKAINPEDEANLGIDNLSLDHNVKFSDKPPITSLSTILSLSSTFPTYAHMFRTRPRIRFNGCYISTVNYPRPGAPTQSQLTWNTPVHIVTYYRYLRFFRDGSCVSLLTTEQPLDVVHHLTKENLHARHNRESMLPSAVMRHALCGRWRLSGYEEDEDEREEEGNLHIETEGVDPKYMYKLHLSLRSAGRPSGIRNNKLVWKGFWSYNRLTDDWAAFTLRNDRAFFWSRVKSYEG